MRDALSAPAIAAEGTGKLALVYGRKHRCYERPDRRERLADNRRRAEQQAVGSCNGGRDLRRVRRHHIVGDNVDIAAVGDSFSICSASCFCIAIGADIGDHN